MAGREAMARHGSNAVSGTDDARHLDRRSPQYQRHAVKKLIIFLILGGAAGAGIYWWRFAPQTITLSETQLTFAPLQQATMRELVSATGLVEPREILLITSEMPGVVTHVHGKINQHVAEGAVLAKLDDRRLAFKVEEADNGVRMAKAALAQAQANKDAAQSALKVQIELESKGGFRSDKEQAQAQFRAAEAGVQAALATLATANTAFKQAELALGMSTIKVPTVQNSVGKREFFILDRKVNEGQMVGPQAQPMFTLAGALDQVEIHAQVAEGDVNKVKKGQPAVFNVTTFADQEIEFRGVVKEIRPLAANIKGAVFYDTVIEVANQKDPASGEWRLRPGMTLSVDVIRREHKDVWRVPSAALNFQLEEAYQSAAAKSRLAEWSKKSNASHWQTLWIWNAETQTPMPWFVRVGGLKDGEPGLKDSEGNEILESEPGREPTTGNPLRIIIQAPPARAPGFFDRPANIKVS